MSTKENILSITQASWIMIQRMAARTLFLVALTVIGFWALDLLVESGMTDRFALVRRFPEIIPMIAAAAKFTFVEMSVFWIRFGTQPRHDVQNAIEVACTSSMGAAIVHFTNSLVWFARVAIFMYLMSA